MGYKKTFVHNNLYPRCIKIWGEFQSHVIMSNHTIENLMQHLLKHMWSSSQTLQEMKFYDTLNLSSYLLLLSL
jgi:hypothetical protein